MLAEIGGPMNILWKTALRYRELARSISDENARNQILKLALEYEQRAKLLFSSEAVIEAP